MSRFKDKYDALNQMNYHCLLDTFKEYGHHPSDAQLQGLKVIQENLTLQLTGELAPCCYLSFLDPGIGKSTAISVWLEGRFKLQVHHVELAA